MIEHKIVRIVWEDAASVDAWTPKAEILPDLSVIVTVGMLVAESDDAITVGLSHDTCSDSFSSFIHIPKAWIVSREEIKSKKIKRKR